MGWNSGHRGGRCSVILGGPSWPLPVPPAVVNGPSTKWKVRFHSWKSSSHRTWPPAKACWQSTATSYWGWPTVGLRTCRNPQASVGVLRHENTPHVPENICCHQCLSGHTRSSRWQLRMYHLLFGAFSSATRPVGRSMLCALFEPLSVSLGEPVEGTWTSCVLALQTPAAETVSRWLLDE